MTYHTQGLKENSDNANHTRIFLNLLAQDEDSWDGIIGDAQRILSICTENNVGDDLSLSLMPGSITVLLSRRDAAIDDRHRAAAQAVMASLPYEISD